MTSREPGWYWVKGKITKCWYFAHYNGEGWMVHDQSLLSLGRVDDDAIKNHYIIGNHIPDPREVQDDV